MSDERAIQPIQPHRQIASPQVQNAIARASEQTGIDFGYLLAQAKVESGLDASAKARTSSASGLFQFIESTWLDVMQRHGPSFGLGQISSSIETGPGGPKVRDPIARGHILSLRNDPHIASLMAGAFAQENSEALTPVLGREPDAGELYLAHFLGSGGASKFLTALRQDPSTPAADMFGKAAAANRSIFYERSGASRSLAGVMELLRGKIESAMPSGGTFLPQASGDASDWTQIASSGLEVARTSSPFSSTPFPRPFASSPAIDRGADSFSATPKLSAILQDSFGAGGRVMPGAAGEHAQRAYAKLQAFGL